MATGITSNAVSQIQHKIDIYRDTLYRANFITPVSGTSAFSHAIKGTNTKRMYDEAVQTMQDLIDRYTANMQNKLKDSIKDVNSNYAKQDSNSTTFVSLKNKYKS